MCSPAVHLWGLEPTTKRAWVKTTTGWATRPRTRPPTQGCDKCCDLTTFKNSLFLVFRPSHSATHYYLKTQPATFSNQENRMVLLPIVLHSEFLVIDHMQLIKFCKFLWIPKENWVQVVDFQMHRHQYHRCLYGRWRLWHPAFINKMRNKWLSGFTKQFIWNTHYMTEDRGDWIQYNFWYNYQNKSGGTRNWWQKWGAG